MLQAIVSFYSMNRSNLIEYFKTLLLLIIAIVRCKQLVVLEDSEAAKPELYNLLRIVVHSYYIMNAVLIMLLARRW